MSVSDKKPVILFAPDTLKNLHLYPQSRSQKPSCGSPLLKLVGVLNLTSGALLDYLKGHKHQQKRHSVQCVVRKIRPLHKPANAG
ncbi:MAG: hypothetical protein BWX48_01359 [Verrucomicrobia bacterium ADurb.Bin006]|nr:MAG: hypothetical protein BWX48_01359 [Verrucomicrobia bacterium ADurb.Bin006]